MNKIQSYKASHPEFSYKRISRDLEIPLSTVRYHLNPKVKADTKARAAKRQSGNLLHILKRKKDNFQLTDGWRNKKIGKRRRASLFTAKELLEKLVGEPVCYLTGDVIDLLQYKTYRLDHIVPLSRGGGCDLTNCGLTTTGANQAKSNMTPDEFLSVCLKVVKHNGFSVGKLADR